MDRLLAAKYIRVYLVYHHRVCSVLPRKLRLHIQTILFISRHLIPTYGEELRNSSLISQCTQFN